MVELDLDFNAQVFMIIYNIYQSYDFNEVPGGTMDLYNCITYIRDMKSTKERVLTNIWQPARELYLGLLLHGIIVNVFRILNLRLIVKPERQSFPLDFDWRTCFPFLPRNCERFHSD